MKLSKFKYNLPDGLIALHPTENRDESKLMVLDRKTKTIEHRIFKDIKDYFNDKDVMVFQRHQGFPGTAERQQGKNGCRN